MVRVGASDRHIALDVVTDIVFLDDGVAVLNNQYAFFVVLVDLVAVDRRKGLFFNPDAGLVIEADEVIVQDLGAVVFALDEDAVFEVACDADVLLDDGLADELLVGSAGDAVELALLDLVERDDRKRAVDLYPVVVLEDEVAADVGLASQADLNAGFVLLDAVVDDLELELLADQVDADGVALDEGFYYLGVAVLDAPDQDAAVSVVADHAVLNGKSA